MSKKIKVYIVTYGMHYETQVGGVHLSLDGVKKEIAELEEKFKDDGYNENSGHYEERYLED